MPTVKAVHTKTKGVKSFLQRRQLLLSPVAGSLLFLVLYFLAASAYPGGSQADSRAKGFSWMHDYWCNLLAEKAINGQANAARPLAYTALAFLALSLLSFWMVAAQTMRFAKRTKLILLLCGVVSLLLLPFLTTPYHDTAINVSASLGLVVMCTVYAGLYRAGWYFLASFGLFNLLLIALNNYIYYCTSLYWLPLVQKFTFLSFLLWVCFVTLKIYRQQRGT